MTPSPGVDCLLQLLASWFGLLLVSLFLRSCAALRLHVHQYCRKQSNHTLSPSHPLFSSQSPDFFMYVHALLFTNEVLLDTNNACSPMDVSTDQRHMKKALQSTIKKILHLL